MTGKVELLTGQNDLVANYVAAHVPACSTGWPGWIATVGFVLDGELIGGTVYHGYEPEWGLIEMSSAASSPRWLTRDTLRAILGYPFLELNCRNVVMRVSSLNTRMCSIAERFGFSRHALPDLRGEGEDDVVYILSRKAWEERRYR